MDVVSFARLLAQTLGNDRWFTEDVISETFKGSGPSGGTVKRAAPKAVKIPLIKSEEKVLSSLMGIHNLLQGSLQEKLKASEKQSQFIEEQQMERKKQNDEFLQAIKAMKAENKEKPKAATAEKVTPAPEAPTDVLGSLSELKDMSSTLFKIGRFFLYNPIGIALLAGTSLLGLLALDKNPEATTKGMLAAGDVGEANRQMMEVVENTTGAERRKQNLLSQRPSEFKASFYEPWNDKEYQDKYLEKIGFDPKTGLTEAEKNEGFTGVDDNGVPYKKPKAVAPTGGGRMTMENDPRLVNPDEPAPTVSPAASAPSAVPSTTNVDASTTSLAPVTDNSITQKFNNVNSENVELKLPQVPSERGAIITNNQMNQQRGESTRQALPFVRNPEETFQRMIMNSTRVV